MELHDAGHVIQGVFSFDGNRVLTRSADDKAQLWDSHAGTLQKTLQHPMLRDASLSPDGTKVVTCSSDATAILWDSASGKAVATLKHGGPVLSAMFSPDGTQFITRSDENVARLWNATSGKETAVLASDAPVVDAHFCDGGAKLVTVSSRSVVNVAHIWDARSGKELGRFRDMRHVEVSEDGRRMIGLSLTPTSGVTVRLWDIAAGELIATVDDISDFAENVAFAPDAKSFAAW